MPSLIEKVFKNQLEEIESALSQGANPDEVDGDGRTALIHAVIDNRFPIVSLLLNKGASVDATDLSGNTALHFAAQEFNCEIARLLVANGATVDIVDTFGNTPLGRAVFNSQGRGEMISLLLHAGANPHHMNKRGKSPVELAMLIGNYDVSQFFL